MRHLVLISLILIASFATNAQTKSQPVKKTHGPDIQFVATSHDFGTIDEGIKVVYDFEFTSTGDSSLILLNVQASCGCTVPTWPRKPIKPGEKGKISVAFNSAGRAGENFHKSITVTTNQNQDNVKIIYIRGLVARKSDSQQQNAPEKTNQN